MGDDLRIDVKPRKMASLLNFLIDLILLLFLKDKSYSAIWDKLVGYVRNVQLPYFDVSCFSTFIYRSSAGLKDLYLFLTFNSL